MITPRETRLFRVPDLRAYQRTIRGLIDVSDARAAQSCAVIVPSAAAADQLRRTIENHCLRGGQADGAVFLPYLVTRQGWYDVMHARLPEPPRRLSELEREVLLNAAAREAARSTLQPPFRLRPALLVEMLGLYDDLRRRGASVDTFERLLAGDLERDAEMDRGAERLLRQTAFLAAAFRAYETRRAATRAVDEYTLRTLLLETAPRRALRHVIVTVGERAVDPAGLWPADFDLLTRLPLLERIDIVATHGTIAAGLLDRLDKFMPGFEEAAPPPPDGAFSPAAPTVRVSRDREDELSAVAVALKTAGGSDLDRRAVVFKRPLPYVYLARHVFDGAAIPYQTFDALPLAAEPYAAALDLVFEFVSSNFTRETVIALLSSPHFTFAPGGHRVRRDDVAALNRELCDQRYFGGAERLARFAERGSKAGQAAADAAAELKTLTEPAAPSSQLKTLLGFLESHDRLPAADDPLRERHLRARHAIVSALHLLRQAHRDMDDAPVEFVNVAAMIRRWIGGQTFAPRAGASGVQLVDAQAARYGDFEEIFLVGLVEGEWPERSAKNIFYPPSLLSQLDWPDPRLSLAGERAAFHDLVALAGRRVFLSTFELEHDAIVGPSVFLEEIRERETGAGESPQHSGIRIFTHEALTEDPVAASAVTGEAARWLHLRANRTPAERAQYHGTASPYRPAHYSVSGLERYLQCPFRFFAERVLRLEEDPETEATLNPLELGRFVHEVFEAFFAEWNRQGHRAITPANLPQAREIFGGVADPLLAKLPDAEAAVLRTRLLGSAVDEGLAEAVFQVEAEWDTPVAERLLEHALEGEFEMSAHGLTRRVALRGKADRIDLLEDGTFRLIDYKLSRAPDRKHALQLPIYTVCTVQQLKETRGQSWEPGQAGYIAFGEERRFVPMLARGKSRDAMLADAQARLLDAVDRIERGDFPPTPVDPVICTRCAYAAVCRKEYVGDV